MRFLSHAETVRVFQRACVRAGLKIRYSQGFNPRPRLSLPLPRAVGVESDADLLCLWINCKVDEPITADYELRIKAELSEKLPLGLELLSVKVTGAKSTPQPCLAKYVFKVRPEYLEESLKVRIKDLLEQKRLDIDRLIKTEKSGIEGRESNIKGVDVRPFLKSIELADKSIFVECGISSAGSIRVQEIMELLELDVDKLAAPVRRTSIEWEGM